MIEKMRVLSKDMELLLDYHDDPMVISDIDGKILTINSKFAKIFNIKNKNELIGKSGFDVIGKKVIKNRKEAIKIVLETKKPYKFIDHDQNRWWSTEIKPIMNKEGNIVKFAIYIKDINVEKSYEQKLESILNQSLMGIGIIEGDKVTYVNNTVELITGFSKKEIIEGGVKFISKIIHPEDRTFVMKKLKKKILGDTNVINQHKFKLISKSGIIKWIETNSKTIFLNGKNVIMINIIDISQRKKTEESLKESEERWNSLVDNLPESDRILIIDKSGKIIYLNRTYPGQNYENIIGKKFDEFIQKDSINNMKDQLKEVFDKNISKKYDTSIITPDGENRFFQSITAPIIKDNKTIAALCIAIDNTKLRNTEKELKLNTNYLNNILDGAYEIIFTINSEKKIVIWNKSAQKKTGYTKKNIFKKSIKDLNLFENKSEIDSHITNLINGKKSFLKEMIINTKLGNKILLGVSSTIIKNESNIITDVLFVCWDITYRKDTLEPLLSGKSYFLFDNKIDKAIKIFDKTFDEIQKGLIISRDINYIIDKTPNKEKIDIIKLSSLKEEKIKNISGINEFINQIENYLRKNKKSIILIDRIDYLISIHSFENVIQALYEINDYIINSNSILLIRINSSLLASNQIIQIEQEYNKIPEKIVNDIKIDEDMYMMLNYINKNNENNSILIFKLEKQFNISKSTLNKRLEIMKNNDLIYYKGKGRSKLLYLSDKGKNYLK